MGQTTRGIIYPAAGESTRLWEHLQGLAESVDAAIEAALTAPAGGGGTAPEVQAGIVTVNPVANTPTKKAFAFAVPFETAPIVTAVAISTVPGTVVEVTVASVTNIGVDVWVRRTNTTATQVMVIATGKTQADQ